MRAVQKIWPSTLLFRSHTSCAVVAMSSNVQIYYQHDPELWLGRSMRPEAGCVRLELHGRNLVESPAFQASPFTMVRRSSVNATE